MCAAADGSGTVLDVREGGASVRATSPATGAPAGLEKHDFACGYEITIPPGDDRTSEQWARSVAR